MAAAGERSTEEVLEHSRVTLNGPNRAASALLLRKKRTDGLVPLAGSSSARDLDDWHGVRPRVLSRTHGSLCRRREATIHLIVAQCELPPFVRLRSYRLPEKLARFLGVPAVAVHRGHP